MNELWQPRREAAGTVAMPLHRHSIVFLGTAHDGGGSSVLASTLASAMREDGHHVEEWIRSACTPTLHLGLACSSTNGARVHQSPSLFCSRVVNAYAECKPDAVFGLQPLSNLLAAAAGALAGIRYRIGTHHLPYDQFNPLLMKLDGVAGRLGLYSDLLACGQSVADTYRHNGEAYMRRLRVIPNGHRKPVTAERAAARAAFGLPPKGAVLGQLGRLYHQKNQRFSIGLLGDLPDTSLLMIGSGPDETLVRTEIASKGYEDRVRLHLHIDHTRIGEFYSAIDAVLFPSSFEGLSLAAIEAIHAGVPLVCSDIPSFREMFRDSPFLAGHLIVPLGDRAAWLERVRAILGDETLRAQIIAELQRLSPRYAFETMSAKYLALLD